MASALRKAITINKKQCMYIYIYIYVNIQLLSANPPRRRAAGLWLVACGLKLVGGLLLVACGSRLVAYGLWLGA